MKKLLFTFILSIIFGGGELFAQSYTSTRGLAMAEIGGSGTAITGLGDDTFSGPLPIGFSFNYYGAIYTQFYIGSNGVISFGAGNSGPYGTPFPSSRYNNTISFASGDLNCGVGSPTLNYFVSGSSPNRILVVNFKNVQHYGTPSNLTSVQIQLFETTNKIELHISNISSGFTRTIGVGLDIEDYATLPSLNGFTTSISNEMIRFEQGPFVSSKAIDIQPGQRTGGINVYNKFKTADYSSSSGDIIGINNLIKRGESYYSYTYGYNARRLVASQNQALNNSNGDVTIGVEAVAKNKYNIGYAYPATYGVYAQASSLYGGVYGVFGSVYSNIDTSSRYNYNYGVYGTSSTVGSNDYNYGIYGSASNNNAPGKTFAGYFLGNVHISGTLSKSSGSFKIDHPQDPANKYLVHSFVESPDMMNMYNGNITTDGSGLATVVLPTYFEALNIEFRYQLTVIGKFAQAIVKEEIKGNSFIIETDKPNTKVSWLVTGVRNDAYARKNRLIPEQDKPNDEKGKYLNPEVFDLPKNKNIHFHEEVKDKNSEEKPPKKG